MANHLKKEKIINTYTEVYMSVLVCVCVCKHTHFYVCGSVYVCVGTSTHRIIILDNP